MSEYCSEKGVVCLCAGMCLCVLEATIESSNINRTHTVTGNCDVTSADIYWIIPKLAVVL